MSQLATDQARVSISICPAGCVRIQFGIAIVHLTEDEFRSFVQASDNALEAIDRRRTKAASSARLRLTH